jgi:hypothetical protein
VPLFTVSFLLSETSLFTVLLDMGLYAVKV